MTASWPQSASRMSVKDTTVLERLSLFQSKRDEVEVQAAEKRTLTERTQCARSRGISHLQRDLPGRDVHTRRRLERDAANEIRRKSNHRGTSAFVRAPRRSGIECTVKTQPRRAQTGSQDPPYYEGILDREKDAPRLGRARSFQARRRECDSHSPKVVAGGTSLRIIWRTPLGMAVARMCPADDHL